MNEYTFYIDGFEIIILAPNYFEAARKLRDELDGYFDRDEDEV